MKRKTPPAKASDKNSAGPSRSFIVPDKDRLPAILEVVRIALDRRNAPVFRDRPRQDEFLKLVGAGLIAYGNKGQTDPNFGAMKFRAINDYLDGLCSVLGALTPGERVALDIAAERTFKSLSAGSEGGVDANSSHRRYGRTDGVSRLARLDGLGGYDTNFVLDHYQEDTALLAKAIKTIVASSPVMPPSKKYHHEPNVEQLIAFLGRIWRDVFIEEPSWSPGAAFGSVLNDLFEVLDLKNAGDKTLKRILQP
jgi:hypothetical protein